MLDRKIKALQERIQVFEQRLASGDMSSIAGRNSMRRSIAQCRRRLAEAARGVVGEPSQLRDARLHRKASAILRDWALVSEIDRQRSEAEALLKFVNQGNPNDT